MDETEEFVMASDSMANRSDMHLARHQPSGQLSMNSDEYYKLTNSPGKYLIFNHSKFNFNSLGERHGTKHDVTAITNTFDKLGFEGKCHDNLSSYDIIENIKEAFQGNFHKYASLFVFILTHGGLNGTLCAYDEEYNLEEQLSVLMENQSPSLVGKPKVFIIQACQGAQRDSGIGSSGYGKDDDSNFKLPTFCDLLFVYAAPNGFVSYRNTERGTYFIQHICKTLNERCKKEDFETILKVARRGVALETLATNFKQIPIAVTTLIRTFYLTREALEYSRRH